MLALPSAATAGEVVRLPSSDSIGSAWISPCTVSRRCTLVWLLVVSADCCISVAASGRCELSSELEHPASRAAEVKSAAKIARRRVGMTAS